MITATKCGWTERVLSGPVCLRVGAGAVVNGQKRRLAGQRWGWSAIKPKRTTAGAKAPQVFNDDRVSVGSLKTLPLEVVGLNR